MNIATSIISLALFLALSQTCIISGVDIGYCAINPLQSSNFCTKQLDQYVCIPAHNVTWSQYDAIYKDKQIQNIVLTNLQQQLVKEYLQQATSLQISNNPSCYEAYKKFTCKWNFPACNTATNSSIKMCQSVCDSFQTACGGHADVCSIIYAKTDIGLDSTC